MTRRRSKPVKPAPWLETERQTAELDAVRRMLAASRGTFSLSVAVCNSPALRDYVIDRLRAADGGIQTVRLPKDTADVLAVVREAVKGASPSTIFIIDMEQSLPSTAVEHPTLRHLNGTREAWKATYSCPIVFWVPEYAVRLLMTEARDFWAWRSHQFEFVAETATVEAGMTDRFAGDFTLAGNLPADQKRFRIAELEQRVAEAGDPPPPQLASHVSTWLSELGYLYYGIGDLDQGEAMFKKSLAIEEKLGRLEDRAAVCGNLGNIYRTRGDLDQAEAMHRKSLEIEEKLGRLEGTPASYANLGHVYYLRGDLDLAQAMYEKSLAISEKLGLLEGMATAHGSLGVIYSRRGDLDQAESMHRKSLEIEEKLGRLEETASKYANLGVVYQKRGDLEQGEAMYKKALAIDEKLGRVEGMAMRYGNLGATYKQLGDLGAAREYWTRSRDLYARIGIPHLVEKVQSWLDGLPGKDEGKSPD
ncbi:MAG: tetratricopeptide repeat protein [Planctomycetota bacterium]